MSLLSVRGIAMGPFLWTWSKESPLIFCPIAVLIPWLSGLKITRKWRSSAGTAPDPLQKPQAEGHLKLGRWLTVGIC